MNKQTSDEMSSLAAEVVANGNPLENDKILDLFISDFERAGWNLQSNDGSAVTQEDKRRQVKAALLPTVSANWDTMRRLAGSVLSQDETAGKRGR